MELLVALLSISALYGFAAYRQKRRYEGQLLTERNKISSYEISESQLKQKNQTLTDEVTSAKKGYQDLQKKLESLSMELSQHMNAEQEARSILDSLSEQLSKETNQRATIEEQLHTAKDMVNAASSQLKTTVEERMRELQLLQQQLHNESAARKQLEEIVSVKEIEHAEFVARLQRTEEQLHRAKESLNATSSELHATIERHEHTIAALRTEVDERTKREAAAIQRIDALNGTISSLHNDVASLSEQLNISQSARTVLEHDRTSVEKDLLEKIAARENDLTSLTELHAKISDALAEETNVRIATEHALHESKEKLYALIHELEATVTARDAVVSSQSDQLRQAEKTIRHLQDAVENILSHVPLPVFVVNDNGICSFVNSALQTSVGYAPEDITGRHFSKLFPESERGFYEEQWGRTADKTEQFKGETHVATSAGDTMTVEINFIEIETEAGRSFVGCIFDKTHEREAAKHYTEAKKRDEELRQLKSRFIAMVTNQLRADLVTVSTNTELLERFVFKWSDEKRYRAFFRINESLKHMLDLLRDVESSTASTVNYSSAPTLLNLESLAQEIAKETVSDLDTHHRFILSEQGNISSVPMDERIVRTVLHHTLSNAFKFSPETEEVRLHVERKDSTCTFTVRDNGIGIPPAEQQHLFTSFFRGSNVGNVYGTGLGLTIVQQFVQIAKGTIHIDSDVNKGTAVTITLPLAKI